jgi:hypothetical protein
MMKDKSWWIGGKRFSHLIGIWISVVIVENIMKIHDKYSIQYDLLIFLLSMWNEITMSKR